MDYKQALTDLITSAATVLELPIEPTAVILEHPADVIHGDVATPIALSLFKQVAATNPGAYSSPRELAQKLSNQIEQQVSTSELPNTQVSVAGPGFINFRLSEAFLASKMTALLTSRLDMPNKAKNKQNVVVEYSSPNIAKPFTVGHLRSTIIGDAVANLLEKTGATVFRDNHLGDWGTQFGKQIYAIKTWGDEAAIEQAENPVKELVALYVKFHQEAEQDPSLEDEGRAWFKKLEDGDPEARRLWQKCIDWSWVEFQKIYDKLDVSFTENNGRGYGESYFEDKMEPVIAELQQKDLLQDSEGAKLVFFPEDTYPPLMIIKKDGSTLYSTRDLATDKFRLQQYGADVRIINEVGSEQSLYFKQLYEIEHMLGWYTPEQRVHIGHGLIRFKDKKMSTRKGNVIWLETVLSEAYDKVAQVSHADLPEEDRCKIAIGALKWNDLKRSVHLPVVFDWDELLNLKGNSGPYIQYTYVRCYSLLQKLMILMQKDASELENGSIVEYFDILLNSKSYSQYDWQPVEIDLLRNLYTYFEVLEVAAAELAPQQLCTYLHELAQQFNTFYAQQPLLSEIADGVVSLEELSPTVQARVLLTVAVAEVLRDGLNILGIKTVTKM